MGIRSLLSHLGDTIFPVDPAYRPSWRADFLWSLLWGGLSFVLLLNLDLDEVRYLAGGLEWSRPGSVFALELVLASVAISWALGQFLIRYYWVFWRVVPYRRYRTLRKLREFLDERTRS